MLGRFPVVPAEYTPQSATTLLETLATRTTNFRVGTEEASNVGSLSSVRKHQARPLGGQRLDAALIDVDRLGRGRARGRRS